MKIQTYPALLCTLALLAPGLSFAAYEPAAYQIADPISYTGWNTGASPMNAVWPYANGTAPAISTSGGDIRFVLNNGVTGTTFAHPLTSGFDLTFDALHTSYSRLLWIGLFNDAGTQGYGLAWDSSLSGIGGGKGFVSIRSFNLSAPPTYPTHGTVLQGVVGSGHVATALPMARLRLTWDRDSNTLKLYVDGVLKQTVVDTAFTSFSRLYAFGYTGSIFDNVAVAMPVGANVPFVTHEAEDAANTVNGGTVVAMTSSPSSNTFTPEQEASGRAYVQLNATGDFLSVTATEAANSIVLRHCIPDSATGGGASATLSLYVNGAFRQSLSLSSKYNWLYTSTATAYGQSNDPGVGMPRVFWDETAYRITGNALQAGDIITLKKGSADSAAYYRIDLLDLENVPDALPPPAAGTYLSVADYGANGADSIDDSQAIINCVAAAKTAGKTVWIPAGTYYQSKRCTLDGVTVQGASMWYTNIVGNVVASDWAGNFGFHLSGTGSRVSNLRIESEVITRRGDPGGKPFTGSGTNWEVDHVWVTHTNTGFWLSGSGGSVHDCRVRFTYADAINFNQGCSGALSENNHVRGCGDDGIAILAETDHGKPASANNTHRNNTVIANWWGHNADLAGGDNNVICNNYLADNALMGGCTINSPSSYPMHPLTNSTISGNLIVRGGGPAYGQARGAMWAYTTSGTISDTAFRDNLIIDAVFKGIQVSGGSVYQDIAFSRNTIDGPGTDGVVIGSNINGSGTFTDNTVQNLNTGKQPFVNNSLTTYTTTQSGNSWQ